MSQEIFRRIQSAALENDTNFLVDSEARWIARKDQDDAKLMAEAKIEVLHLGRNVFAASVQYDGLYYFCMCGLTVPENLPSGLEHTELTPGLFSTVILAADLQPKATAAEIRDVIEDQHALVEGYVGHPLSSVADLFPVISSYSAPNAQEYIYIKNLERVAGYYASRGYVGHPLALRKSTINDLAELFESGPVSIPYHLPLQGLFCYRWSEFFLDLYRCVEQLYSAPKLNVLSKYVKSDGSLADLAEKLESILTWRPREEESLRSLLDRVSNDTKSKIVGSIQAAHGLADAEVTADRCAAHIYKLRNSHVHFRPAMRAENINAVQWDGIIASMICVVEEVYQIFGDDFLGISK